MINESFTTGQRVKWLDVLKGIAIFFVVLGHNPYLSQLPQKVFNVIFSFHMPLFIFTAGYLFNTGRSASELLHRRFNSLLKPYLFTMALICLVYIIVKSGHSPLWYVFWLIYGNGPNLPKLGLHLWFLPHLFFVTVFVWLLCILFERFKHAAILILITAAVFLVLGALSIDLFWNIIIPNPDLSSLVNSTGLFLSRGVLENPAYAKDIIIPNQQFILKGLPWSIDILLISTAFFIAGYLAKHYCSESIFRKHHIALPVLILFVTLHYLFNNTIDLNLRRYDNVLICSILAIAGIYICVYLSHILCVKENHLANGIAYIGRYSLIVYIFHQLVQSKFYFAVTAIIPNTAEVVFLLSLIAGIGLPLILNYLVLERFKCLRFWYYA